MRTGIAALITGLFLSGGAFAQNVPVVDIRNGDGIAAQIADEIAARRSAAKTRADAMIEKGAAWVLAGQDASGAFGVYPGAPVFPAVTALTVMGLLDAGRPTTDPAMQRAADFVISKQQSDGAIYDKLLPSYNTAICVSMLARFPDARCADAVKKAVPFLKGLQYGEGAVESAAMGAESAKPVDKSHAYYGGVGYGRSGRPDLSNTAFWVEALKDAGVDKNDPAFVRAVVFLERVQQLESAGGKPVNTMPYAKGTSQGGFIYSTSVSKDEIGVGQSYAGEIAESMSGPPGLVVSVKFKAHGEKGKPVLLPKQAVRERVKAAVLASSMREIGSIGDDIQVLPGAGEGSGANSCEIRVPCLEADRFADLVRATFKNEIEGEASVVAERVEHWKAESRLRAYGSMTYAGFKSYLYAGLTKDDPRVIAAREWIGANYTLTENPCVGTDGLYYYYIMFAKSMAAYGAPTVVTPGGARDWRVDLVDQLATLQNEDGSFRPVDDRWMENDPLLITAYSLNALQLARKSLE